jgi:phosphoglycolate phosphatase-like HAD superfamily hydrolase
MKGLILFDIDNTLIKTSKAHMKAFSEAFKKVYGIESTIEIIDYSGMTDQQIIIEVLKKKGLNEQQIYLKIDECMKTMVEYFDSIKDSIEINVLSGVPKLLEELKNQNFLIGLVTGNLESIARSKMQKANLNHYFKLGGFGSDDISRTKLIKLAIKRAEKCNFKYKNNVFLFGDTPKDMNAGNDAGVTTIGVATGIYTKNDLENAAAHYIFDNLHDTEEIISMISNKLHSL